MDLNLIWYGAIIIACIFLMLGVMWITDRAIEKAQKLWDKMFNGLSKPF